MFVASLVAGAAGGLLVGYGQQGRRSLASWLGDGANLPDYLMWTLIGATIVGAAVYALLIFFDKTE